MYRDDFDRSNQQDRSTDDVYSKPIRAGKRTYFFDVKATKGNNDYYLTITESKRRQERDGSFTYDKHKIFLYKEDFEKFQEGLAEVISFIQQKNTSEDAPLQDDDQTPQEYKSDVEFDEL